MDGFKQVDACAKCKSFIPMGTRPQGMCLVIRSKVKTSDKCSKFTPRKAKK